MHVVERFAFDFCLWTKIEQKAHFKMSCLEVVEQLGFVLVSQGLGSLYLNDDDAIDNKICKILSDYLTSIENVDSDFVGHSQPEILEL